LGGSASVYQGVQHVMHPVEIVDPMINYLVLGFALLFEGVAWYIALREFRLSKGKWGYIEAVKRAKDPSVFVVLFEDSAAMLGLLVAFLGILLTQLTGILYFDGLASIFIGLILIGTAIWLAYETKGLLIGESANQPVVKGIRNILQASTNIEAVNEVLTMHMGPNFILANISVDFKSNLSADEVEGCIADIDQDIKIKYPLVQRVFIEAERAKKHAKQFHKTL